MRQAILIALLGWSLAACSTDPQRSSDPAAEGSAVSVHAAVGDTLRLRPGEVAEVGTDGLRILFRGVGADSRCPQGVTCVWAGDATARLAIALRRAGWTAAELHTHEQPKHVQHENYTVALLDLEPYPREGVLTRADQYVAVIRVTSP